MFGFVVLSWALTLGIVPTQFNTVETDMVAIENIATVAELEFKAVAWDRLSVFGSVETYQYLNGGKLNFSPYRADYFFGAEFYFSENLAIGIDHECDHPVSSRINLRTGEYSSPYNYSSSETRVYVKIGSNVK